MNRILVFGLLAALIGVPDFALFSAAAFAQRPRLRIFRRPVNQAAPAPVTSAANSPNAPTAAQPKITPDMRAAAAATNHLALRLYGQLKAREGNQFLSPTSIAGALAMSAAGAEGQTKQELTSVLKFTGEENQLHAGFGQLQKLLNTPGKGYQLSVANRLWGQQGFKFEDAFLKTTRDQYAAEFGLVDYAQAAAARDAINAWVGDKTAGKITEAIGPSDIRSTTKLILTSAIYFKGTWQYTFPAANTQEAPFHLSADKQIKAPLMYLAGALRYGKVGEVQLVELPYVGDQVAMVVLLPTQIAGLADLEKELSVENLAKWLAALHYEDEMHVYLPKFTFKTEQHLKAPLSALGMPAPFSDAADFSLLTKEKAQRLEDIVHHTYIDVNEEGTEAAAVTGGIGGDAPSPVPQPITFRADHPFVFLIHDKRTGAILFLGRVQNPRG